MHILVINLERSPVRMEKMQLHLQECRLLHKTLRVDAVDGLLLTDNAMQEHGASVRTRLRIQQHEGKKKGASPIHDHWMIDSRQAIGSTLSHVRCWEWLLNSDQQYMVVLEDDARFVDPMLVRQQLQAAVDSDLHGHDMLMLGISGVPSYAPQPLEKNTVSTVVCGGLHDFIGMQSYIVGRRGAGVLLNNVRPIEQHVDFYVATLNQLEVLNVAVMCPAMTTIEWMQGTIPHSMVWLNLLPSSVVALLSRGAVSPRQTLITVLLLMAICIPIVRLLRPK